MMNITTGASIRLNGFDNSGYSIKILAFGQVFNERIFTGISNSIQENSLLSITKKC